MEPATASSMESATASSMEPTAAGTSTETASSESAGAAKAARAPTTNMVRMRNGPRGATTGGVAGMVSRPEVSRIAGTTVTVSAVAVPTVSVSTVSVSTVSVSKVRSSKRQPWGVEPPTERVEENTVVRDERISVKPRVPIPSITGPEAGRIAGASPVRPGRINICLRQIRCPQARPPVEIVHVRLLVESLFLQLSANAESDLVSTLDLNVLTGCLDLGLSVKHSD